MREWEIGAVENIHGALPYIPFAPILALVGVGVNRIGKVRSALHEVGAQRRLGLLDEAELRRASHVELAPDAVRNRG